MTIFFPHHLLPCISSRRRQSLKNENLRKIMIDSSLRVLICFASVLSYYDNSFFPRQRFGVPSPCDKACSLNKFLKDGSYFLLLTSCIGKLWLLIQDYLKWMEIMNLKSGIPCKHFLDLKTRSAFICGNFPCDHRNKNLGD